MLNDVPFEAAFLRAGLLVGLFHERDVPDWAAFVIENATDLAPRLADVAGTRIELSAMREALRPLGESVEERRVVVALLTAVAVDGVVNGREAADLLRVLGHIRSDFRLPPVAAATIKSFEDRAMFARVGARGQVAPALGELTSGLEQIREPGFFRFYFDSADEIAAFVAALSRKLARSRTWTEPPAHVPARAWLLRDGAGHRNAVVLNESALTIVLREFAPAPVASRIPYRDPGSSAEHVIDEATVVPMGADEARAKLAV